jgi:endonuclease YncB( thermonuclease family)
MSARIAALALGVIALAPAAPAAERTTPAPTSCPTPTEPVAVAEVIAGDSLRLTDGRVVTLAGAEVPRRVGRSAIAADAPREDAARAALAALLTTAPPTLAILGPTDRRGALPGRLAVASRDVTEGLVAAGYLRVRPSPAAKPCLAALLAAEATARATRAGLWATEEFRLRAGDDTDLPRLADSYAVVEGRVVSTGRAGSRRYIDFGRNHRTDFTVVIDTRRSAAFAAAGIDLDRLRGRTIRVRGWLTAHDGAEMTLEAPEEMEWADDETKPAPASRRGKRAPG